MNVWANQLYSYLLSLRYRLGCFSHNQCMFSPICICVHNWHFIIWCLYVFYFMYSVRNDKNKVGQSYASDNWSGVITRLPDANPIYHKRRWQMLETHLSAIPGWKQRYCRFCRCCTIRHQYWYHFFAKVIINMEPSSVSWVTKQTNRAGIEQSGRTPKVVTHFSATNFSSNVMELLQLHDTIQIKCNYV